jgi:C4-dicarboxylate-binding protein DctP
MGSVNSVQTRELWQVNDILTTTNRAPVELLLLINEKTWTSLTPAHQSIVAAAARDVERVARDRMVENEAGYYAFARKKGMQVRTLTADQVAEWRACSAGMLEEYMSTGGELARRIMLGYARLRTQPCCTIDPSMAGGEFFKR